MKSKSCGARLTGGQLAALQLPRLPAFEAAVTATTTNKYKQKIKQIKTYIQTNTNSDRKKQTKIPTHKKRKTSDVNGNTNA